MKIQAKILIIVSLVMLILPVISYAETKPRVFIDDVSIENNNKVSFKIMMENIETANKIVALRIDLKYDTSKLEFSGSKAGKDLKATLKYDDNFPDEGRFSIAAISVNGLNNNGLYYTVNFKIKDGVNENIPIELLVSEASDKDGKNVDVETNGTVIKLNSEKKEEKRILEPTNQTVKEFEITETEPITSLENVITENGNIEIREDDILSYEIENSDIVELLEDGTVIPNKDGTTKVKIKLNGQDIGTTEIEVKDGNIVKISGNDEVAPEKYETKVNIAELDTIYTEEEIKESLKPLKADEEEIASSNIKKAESITKSNTWQKILIFIVILFLIFILIKNKKGRKK